MSRKGTVKLDSLKAQRELAGITVGELARRAAVSDWTIRYLEAGGNIEGYVAARIAGALGVSTATLGERVM